MALPPLNPAVHDTETEVSPAGVATTLVGGSGTVAGVTAFDALDAGPAPAAFVAVTVKVYSVPFERPVTVTVVVLDVAETLPGEEVTV